MSAETGRREPPEGPNDLRHRTDLSLWTYPWYHGPINRQSAVDLVTGRRGGFLVRDCISTPGNYVLTCNDRDGNVLHFRMNRHFEGGQTLYQFEGKRYPGAGRLVEHHFRTKEPVSANTLAVLQRPVCRTMEENDDDNGTAVQDQDAGQLDNNVKASSVLAANGGHHHQNHWSIRRLKGNSSSGHQRSRSQSSVVNSTHLSLA